MIVPDFRQFQSSSDILHYGIKQRSGRYPWGSGKRPYQSEEEKKQRKAEKRQNRINRMERRYERKFDKRNLRLTEKQRVANVQFQKAVKKENSLWSTKSGIQKAYSRADEAQRAANREAYKGYKTFERYLRKCAWMHIDSPNENLSKQGEEFYKKVTEHAKGQYYALMVRKEI